MNNFIFDVDGTLTESRARIDSQFHDYFLDFCKKNKVYLVTGSDYPKTREQLGEDILNEVVVSFNCSGNSRWTGGKEFYHHKFHPGQDLISFLNEKHHSSKFPTKGFTNIEYRPGMINFSIVGRPCTLEMRHLYRSWDEHKQERTSIAQEIMEKFPGIVAQVAGETGIDIFQTGKDKGQVADAIPYPITFFGDKMDQGGNDYPLAFRLEGYQGSRCIPVESWKDTHRCLQTATNDV